MASSRFVAFSKEFFVPAVNAGWLTTIRISKLCPKISRHFISLWVTERIFNTPTKLIFWLKMVQINICIKRFRYLNQIFYWFTRQKCLKLFGHYLVFLIIVWLDNIKLHLDLRISIWIFLSMTWICRNSQIDRLYLDIQKIQFFHYQISMIFLMLYWIDNSRNNVRCVLWSNF